MNSIEKGNQAEKNDRSEMSEQAIADRFRSELQGLIEARPFEDPAVGDFFNEWCAANDGIKPYVTSREEWNSMKGDVVVSMGENSKAFFVPEDLQLWEVVSIVKKLDQDTFAQKPERQIEAGERMVKIGKIFRDSGIYVAQRLDAIDQGRSLAKALAEEFYQYGSSIIEEQRSDQVLSLSEIASQELTSEQLEAVDRFLAGDKLYESRRARVEQKLINFPNKEKQKFYEDQRRHTLKQFFRVVEKAFKLHAKDQAEGLRNSVNILQLWRQNTPVHESFLRKVNQSIMTEIDTPSQEINAAVFRRGLERLLREFEAPESFQEAEKAIGNTNKIFNKAEKVMKLLGDLLGFESNSNSVAERKKLIDVLDIDGMKAELEALRQTGDLEKISQAERQMTDQIQEVVSAFSYKASISSPSKMLATKTRNCVGA